MSSLRKNLSASAIDWKNPKGPTRFGPGRSWISALPRRSTQTMIGVTLSSAPTTMAILRMEIATSTLSIPAMRLRARERFLPRKRCGDALENLQIGDRLPFRPVGGVNLLHAALQVRERSLLLHVNGGGEQDVGDFVERMRRIP